jgi:hypothetical protein
MQCNLTGLAARYREDAELALQCRMFTALAFVPTERVMSAFDELKEALPSTEPLWSYFESTYIGHFEAIGTDDSTSRRMATVYRFKKPIFDAEVWNVRDRVVAGEPKTTNSLEAWHRRFNVIIGKSHPNIFEFITRLKAEQSYTELRVDKIYAGNDPIRVKRKQKTQINRVKTIVSNYADYPDIIQFLKGCAHNIEFHV